MKITMTPQKALVLATSGPGPAKQNYRMASVLSFLRDFVSGSQVQDNTLVWAAGGETAPILQSDRMYSIHRTLVSADMDPTSCSPNTTIQALMIALNNKHAVQPGWYQYSNSKRSGILCKVFVGPKDIRAMEIRHDPYGFDPNHTLTFAESKAVIAGHMNDHLRVLQAQVTEAKNHVGITDGVVQAMAQRVGEVERVLHVFASEQQIEALLDQLRELYDFTKPNPQVEQLWSTLVLSVQDTAKDQADLVSHIESRKKRRGEPDEESLRALLRKLGYNA